LPFDWDPNRETMGEYLGRTWPGNGSPGSAGAQPSGAPQPGSACTGRCPPAAPPAYMSDPSYLAFKRALGLEQSTAERGTNDQIDALNRTRGQQLDQLGHYGERSRRDIQGAMESRGSLRSSETVDRLGEQRYGEGVAASQLNDATAERVAALRQALAEQQAGFNTRDTEAQLASTGQSEWQHQQDALMKALTQASATPPPVTGMPDFQQSVAGVDDGREGDRLVAGRGVDRAARIGRQPVGHEPVVGRVRDRPVPPVEPAHLREGGRRVEPSHD
jgi:hypothetical protein